MVIGAAGEASDVVDRLREDIINARYIADEPLRFRSLSDAYGASVSTLREALSRLSAECLVEFQPYRGFRVAAISVEDLADILQARAEIEGVALRRSIEDGDDAWEAQIVAAHYRLEQVQKRTKAGGAAAIAEWELRHREFHQSLIAGCRSRWLIRFCDMLRVQSDRYRHLVLVPPGTYPQLVAHHRPIMEAAIGRRADEACRMLAEHFEESLRVIKAGIGKRRPKRGATGKAEPKRSVATSRPKTKERARARRGD